MKNKSYSRPYLEEILISTVEALCTGSIPDFTNGNEDGQEWGKDPED